ncbi:hypothetical protein CerSpe_124450 [Prunus speciosa]
MWFGILQARWAIIRGAARMLDEEVLRSIMMTCIILHNMIMEDENDCDAPEVFKPDPRNMAVTRIYERPMGANEQPMEQEPLIRDGRYNNLVGKILSTSNVVPRFCQRISPFP